MKDLPERWKGLLTRVDNLELRQRSLLFVGLIVVFFALWQNLLMGPLDARRERLSGQVSRLRADIGAIHGQIGRLADSRTQDPNLAFRARLGQLREEIAGSGEHLESLTQQLIPPKRMAEVLESLLTRDTGLTLVGLEATGYAPILDSVTEPDAEGLKAEAPKAEVPDVPRGGEGLGGLYRHGLRLVFKGSYLNALEFLQEMEGLPWQFIWGRLDVDVEEHPSATVTLEVYTLSFDDAWLEV